jgi:hypothetical protein
MPLSPTSNEPEHVSEPESAPSDAPVSVVPHDADGTVQHRPVKIRTSRFGELDEHELVRLLDTIEDERARSRFRESVYISLFFWMVVLWLALYGPRYLWHAPKVVALKEQALSAIPSPHLHPHITKPAMRVDNKTLETLRKNAPPTPTPPVPTPVQPAPATTPTPAATPLPATPQPTHAAAPTVDAPSPQPHVNFPSAPSPSNAVNSAIHGTTNPGGNYGPGARAPNGANVGGGMEVLSDMQGVDFSAWLRRMHDDVMRNWEPLLPEETEPPISKQGETYIRIKINPDGSIADMHLDGSSHDVAIDKSCWGSLTSEGQFPPLPRLFHGPFLELRLHYMVNRRVE